MAEEYARRQVEKAELRATEAESRLEDELRAAHEVELQHAAAVSELQAELHASQSDLSASQTAALVDRQAAETSLRAELAQDLAQERQRCSDLLKQLQAVKRERSDAVIAARKEGAKAAEALQTELQNQLAAAREDSRNEHTARMRDLEVAAAEVRSLREELQAREDEVALVRQECTAAVDAARTDHETAERALKAAVAAAQAEVEAPA